MYVIKEQLISKNRPGRRSQQPALGIVIHSTATPGATAQNEYNYFNSGDRKASVHYFADWLEIIRTVPEVEIAWHAGPTANSRYISIEMCEPGPNDPDRVRKFNEVWSRTVWCVADACVRYGWTTKNNVFSHYGCSVMFKDTDHTDPIGFLKQYGKTWEQLLAAIESEILKLKGGSQYMENLILYYGEGDRDIALNYADELKCPVIRASLVTEDLLKAAKNKFQVGGISAPAGVELLSGGAGSDRFDTYAAVLKKLGKIK